MITDSEYRRAFNNFHVLHKVKTVVFGLSASIPPSLYPVLCELTKMTWNVLRTPSTRKELKYQVIRVRTEEEMDAGIVAYVESAIASYGSKDRAMVFCRTKDQARGLATRLKTQAFYAAMDDKEERNLETMDKWLAGGNIVMVSTSILGCGFDYAHIRDVVHRGPAYTLLDQYQEDSRGGRDGLECRATTFIIEGQTYTPPASLYDLGTKVLYESMHERTACLRAAPTRYLDGRPTYCILLPGAAFCGNCSVPPSHETQVIRTSDTRSEVPSVKKRRKISHDSSQVM